MYKFILCCLLISPVFANEQTITEESFVPINGIEQWITIKGDRSKPAILFLHGGPGSPISPYSDTLYKSWEKDFIIVQWDQRGTGKTFGKSAPAELSPEYLKANPLTVDQMTSDGIAVAEYLIKHLEKQKVILFGTSWGSLLGVMMATKQPDLFYAYVGHSQIVKPNRIAALYNKVDDIAHIKNDKEALAILTAIGKPPYDKARKLGQLFKVVKKYEKQTSTPAPESWFVESAGYNEPKDVQNRSDGDDYSFVNFAGDEQLGVQSMVANIDFMKDHFDFKIPVYLIQGKQDILTPGDLTRQYFTKIKAPSKNIFYYKRQRMGLMKKF